MNWSIPNNWIQCWIAQPTDFTLQFPQVMINFNSGIFTLPSGFDFGQFGTDFWAWWLSGIGGWQKSYYSVNWQGLYYSNLAFDSEGVGIQNGPPMVVGDSLLPAMSNVFVRRISNIFERGSGSILRFSGIEESYCEGSFLRPSVYAAMAISAQNLRVPFVSQTVTFTPLIPYYSLSTFRQASKIFLNQRVTTLKRRGRLKIGLPPATLGPVPFP